MFLISDDICELLGQEDGGKLQGLADIRLRTRRSRGALPAAAFESVSASSETGGHVTLGFDAAGSPVRQQQSNAAFLPPDKAPWQRTDTRQTRLSHRRHHSYRRSTLDAVDGRGVSLLEKGLARLMMKLRRGARKRIGWQPIVGRGDGRGCSEPSLAAGEAASRLALLGVAFTPLHFCFRFLRLSRASHLALASPPPSSSSSSTTGCHAHPFAQPARTLSPSTIPIDLLCFFHSPSSVLLVLLFNTRPASRRRVSRL